MKQKFKAREIVVEAEQVDYPRVITVRGGVLNVPAGDWLVYDGAGYHVLTDAEFKRQYVVL